MSVCWQCNGTGRDPSTVRRRRCKTCKGSGEALPSLPLSPDSPAARAIASDIGRMARILRRRGAKP